jgi:hypothetical protein
MQHLLVLRITSQAPLRQIDLAMPSIQRDAGGTEVSTAQLH